jgi:hypothetical protein
MSCLIQICDMVQYLHLWFKCLHLWQCQCTYLGIFLVMYSNSPCPWFKSWDHLLLNTTLSYTLDKNTKTSRIWPSPKIVIRFHFGTSGLSYPLPSKAMHLVMYLPCIENIPTLPMPWTRSPIYPLILDGLRPCKKSIFAALKYSNFGSCFLSPHTCYR